MPGYCDDFYFDSSLFKGSAFGQNIEQFNHEAIPAGDYLVDVWLNNQLVKSGVKLKFIAAEKEKNAVPCLPLSLIEMMQIKLNKAQASSESCAPLSVWVPAGKWAFDPAALRLQLTVPLSALHRTPRGYIPPSQWDKGISALFIRHNTNYTWTENSSAHYRYQYLWSGITAGTNLDSWQLRHQGNLRYLSSSTEGGRYHYNSVRSWVQHPIESMNSLISIGDNYTDSSSAVWRLTAFVSPPMNACGRRAAEVTLLKFTASPRQTRAS